MATIFRPPQIFRWWRSGAADAATSSQTGVTQDRNNTLLASQDKFFDGAGKAPNYDWPNPILRVFAAGQAIVAQAQVWQNRLLNTLRSQDTFFGSAGMGPDYDWPNPTLPKSRAAAISSQDAVTENRNVNLLARQDKFFGPAGMGPDYDWPNPNRSDLGRYAAVYAQSNVWANLLGTLLAVTVVAAPFAQADWPNPRGASNRAAYACDAPNLLVTTLAVPFSQDDWPNPRGARLPQVIDAPNLLGTALAGAGAAPFQQLDWSNPRGIRGGPPADAANLLGTLLAVAPAASPFAQTDWPNPKGPVNRIGQAFDPPSLAGSLLPPFGQDDWPNPTTLPRSSGVAIAAQPNGQTIILQGRDQFFGSAGLGPVYQWPNPARPARSVAYDPPNLLGSTLAPIVSGAPFGLEDWPNPLRAVGRAPLLDLPAPLALRVAAPATPPFAQADWPVPRGTGNRTALDLAAPNLSAGLAPPFSQNDWPNPRGSRPAYATDAPNLLSGTLAPNAFRQLDWANPRPALRLLQGVDAPNLLGTTLAVVVPGKPFQQPDWPNPRGPINRVALALVPQAFASGQPPAPPPPPPVLLPVPTMPGPGQIVLSAATSTTPAARPGQEPTASAASTPIVNPDLLPKE